MKPQFFDSAGAFRAWLQEHHASEPEQLVGFRKRATGKGGITWQEAVDQALCFGWVDGVRKRIDDAAYTIRFTPRKPGSTWSAVNVKRIAELRTRRLMTEAGLAAFARRTERKTGTYSYERAEAAVLEPGLAAILQADRAVREFHEAQAPSYQRKVVHWIMSGKSAATRERRVRQLVAAYEKSRRL